MQAGNARSGMHRAGTGRCSIIFDGYQLKAIIRNAGAPPVFSFQESAAFAVSIDRGFSLIYNNVRGDIMNIVDIEQINALRPADIADCDEAYRCSVQAAADRIYANRGKAGVILLAGPSGSSKTGTALMLEAALDKMGAETHTISLDNYFLPFTDEQRILYDRGELDLESPDRLDGELLSSDIEDLSDCKPVRLPIYDFIDSKRSYREDPLVRKPGEIILMEGIHALNPTVVRSDSKKITNVYVSVDTGITYGGELFEPQYVRLVRRMLRDSLTRGRSMEETVAMFDSVEVGSRKYIEPYRSRADFEFDSFKTYEMPVYRSLLESGIGDIPVKCVRDILKGMCGIGLSLVPRDSLIREFVGN